MGIKEKFTKKYKTKDLYVGLLGFVSSPEIDYYTFKSVDQYVIYRKKKFFNDSGSFEGDYVGQDLFTNREYFFFRGNLYTIDTVYKAVGSLAICKFYPLELFLPGLGDTVTKSQLLELCNSLNKFAKKEEAKKDGYGDSDRFCETLLGMNSWLETIKISEDSRRKMSKIIEELKQCYIEAELDSLIYKKNNVKTKRRTK